MEYLKDFLLWALALYGIYIALRLWMLTLAVILFGLILVVPMLGFVLTCLTFSIYDVYEQNKNKNFLKIPLIDKAWLILLYPLLKASLLFLAISVFGYLAMNSSASPCDINIRFC
jgi:hypothetical protein